MPATVFVPDDQASMYSHSDPAPANDQNPLPEAITFNSGLVQVNPDTIDILVC